MSTSPVNASPISPEEVAGGAGSNKAGPKGHNRRLSKSPSRGLSGKYPASFPSGRTLSTPIIPDVLSDENIEMLGSHIVHQVQNALQDQGRDLDLDQDEDHDHVMRLSYNRDGATNSSGKLPRRATVTAAMGESEAVPSDSKAKAPAKDLWLQVGAEGGESSKRRAASSLSNTRPSGKGISTTTTAASIASSGSSSTLQTKVLESVVEDCLMNFRAGIRNDIQNMHLELLRQFQIQKMEMEGMLKRYTDTKELREEVERLKEENERLRMNY
ncbi:hypothetical protein B0O80DRAFT_457576 [Mortierella sp. GBAus27b]|nr:hypothetical protein B0O80DRAFT_457576 [Mortierella sp. GBAus27b]